MINFNFEFFLISTLKLPQLFDMITHITVVVLLFKNKLITFYLDYIYQRFDMNSLLRFE